MYMYMYFFLYIIFFLTYSVKLVVVSLVVKGTSVRYSESPR